MLDDTTVRDPNSPPSIPNFDDFVASKKAKTAGVRPALTWGAARKGHRHEGQDFGGAMDSDVGSADDGEVVFSGNNGNMGNAVKIRHSDGTVSVYGHLNKINVQVGNRVKRGASIGLLGQTGNAKGPHVHFETYQNDLPIDPAGTSLRPRVGASQTSPIGDKASQQPSPEIPAFDDWVKAREQEPPKQGAAPLKTPSVTSTVKEVDTGTEILTEPVTAPKPIAFKQGTVAPTEPVSLNPVKTIYDELSEPDTSPRGIAGLQAKKFETPDSHQLSDRVTLPISSHVTPSDDEVVNGYLSTLGPQYVKAGEQYKAQTGHSILTLGGGALKQDEKGNYYVRPSKGAVGFINTYVQSGGDLNKAMTEAQRQVDEHIAAQNKAFTESKLDVAEAKTAEQTAKSSPVLRGMISGTAGAAQAFGSVLPGSVGDEFQRQAAVERAASEQVDKDAPLTTTEDRIKAGIGGLIPTAAMLIATHKLGPAQLAALGVLQGSTPQERLRGGLHGAAAQAVLGGAPAAFSEAGLPTTGKAVTSAAMVGQPATEAWQRGESPVQAITENLPFAVLPWLRRAGKPKAGREDLLGIDRAATVGVPGEATANIDQRLSEREARIKPPPDAIPRRDLVKRPEIRRAVEPDAGDPRFRGLDDDALLTRIETLDSPTKGTSKTRRIEMAQDRRAAIDEFQRRQTTAGEQQIPGDTLPGPQVNPSDVPSFREFVEEHPQGGVRFDALAPDDPLFKQRASEYVDLYGTAPHSSNFQPRDEGRFDGAPEYPKDLKHGPGKGAREAKVEAKLTPKAEAADSDTIRQAIQSHLDETEQTIDQITSDPDSRDQRDATAATAEVIQERLSAQGHDADYGKVVNALYDLRDEAAAKSIPTFENWQKEQDAKPKPPAKALKPVPTLTMGRESRSVTERGSEIDSRYAVVNLDDLITSHDSALNANPDFPPELQPRERDRAASADQVSRIASNLRPEFLGESPKASEGAPIVGPDGVVESGNGRVLGLRQAYESRNRGSRAYRGFLLDNAEKFGLDPAAIRDAKSPVLVRVRTTEVDRPKFVREANEQSISSMSPMEQARSDARSLKGPLLDLFQPSESGDIGSAGNLPFVRAFMKDVIGPNEVNRYVTSSGHISQEGISRIRNAIFARAYGDSPKGLIALEKIAEDPDNNVRNLTTAMLRNAGGFASLKEGIDQNTRYPLDLAPDISAAMSKLSHLREKGMPVNDYLNQGALYGNDLTPLQRRLLQVFDENKRGANIIDGIMRNYLRGADAAGSPTQEGLFGDAYIPSKEDFLETAIKEAIDGQTVSRSLFAAQDQGLPSRPAARGSDSAANAPGAISDQPNAGNQPRAEPDTRPDTRIAKPPSDQGADNPVKRLDSTIDRLKDQEQQARDRLAERGAQADELFSNQERGATTIPQDIYDFVVIGASKLAQRSLSVAQFVDEMVREFGAAIRSRAREIFKLSRKMVTDTQAQIRNERLSEEIANRLFTENVPKEQQIAAMKIASQFRTTSDTQGKFIAGFKSRVGEMAKSYGAAGAELTNKLHEGDISRAHEMEAGNVYLSRVKDVYDDIKNDFERQRVSRSVIDALEDRANADRYLDTPQKQTVYENTRDMLDEFRTKLKALGYETRDDYFTHMRDVDILDQIMSDAKDPHEASLNDRVAAESRFLRPREDAKIEIQKDLPRVLFTYLKSVTKEISYSDAVEYYYEHFANDIPIGLQGNKMDRAIKLMQNSLDPEKGRGAFYRVAGKLRSEQYRNFLAYNLKASAQNFTQVDFARMRWTPEARSLSSKLWRQRKTLTGPLADAIDIASTEETPLMRFLEQFSGSEDPSGTRGRFSKAFDKYDPFQRSERRNWALSELGSIINSVVKRPEYKALKAKMGAEGAINEMLTKPGVFDAAVREASTTAAETQVASNPAMRGEFYDAPLHRIIGMFTAFKTRQLQTLGEALRSHEGINGARAQTILRRGLSGDAQPVEVLREVETQRKAMETMLKRARKFDEDIGISPRQMQGMIDHLKTQEGELNGIIKRIEPLSGSRVRSAVLVGKYFAKVSAISVFFNLFWNSVYDSIIPPEKDQDADERVSTALKRAFWDVLPSPFYGADPSKFLVSPVAPNFEKSAPYGHITRRGLAQDVVSYGSTVVPFAGVIDRAANRGLSRGMVNLVAPKTEKAKKAEY